MEKSIYKGVYYYDKNQGKHKPFYFSMHKFNGVRWRSKNFETDIEAAKAYDMRLIELGLNPVNILKPKL